ncbi:amino acid adenylation domain-containing protein [Nonomuraea sp. NPDC049504]|uniref:amino acid adenylation domain-containing protein n=1 Tax=Nonomuraea sp. NPDC049504 TaxID=3154729 RepID=UPI00342048FB
MGLLPGLFAAQAARTPGAVAVVDGGRELDYATLERRANQVANGLLARGVRPETPVGVCLRRGAGLVAALLGVWKAGAAYVPLDPGHPADRTHWILTDTATPLVLTDPDPDPTTASGTGPDWDLVLPDGAVRVAMDAFDGEPGTSPDVAADPDRLAYVIYTSGSTGRPKGVLIGHGAIANRVTWTVREHGLGPADRVLQKTTLTFDAAGWEIFAPLVSGGAVVLAPHGAERDPAALLRAVAAYDVSVLQVVPSLLRLLVDEPGWRECGALRLLFSAGEPLDAELCELVRKRLPVTIWNTYGPTECAIDVTAHLADPEQSAGRVPIGRPIDGIRLRVLDEGGALAPLGAPGELHAGGVGLARGYLGRPALTAERFLPDPYGPPGSRMYRTGDLVRWRPDGTLDYDGRIDAQVKVNGVRIEPGEVESVLLTHPGLRGAAVTAGPGADGAARLVAYVVGRDGEPPQAAALRAYLRDRLPDALVPSLFVPLAALPLTTSGKVDRAALPAPDFDATSDGPARPLTNAEQTVARVWQDLLGVTGVRADDDFFQRGGSSLLLARLAARLSAAVGREVAVHRLFAAGTVAEQARLVEEAAEPVATVPRAPRDRPLPLSVEQHQLWFLDRMDPGNPEWVTPLLVPLPADLGTATVERAMTALVARHEVLRTRYRMEGGEPRQVVDDPAPVTLPVADRPDDPAALAELLAGTFREGFDLVRGPVWRALLVRGQDAAPAGEAASLGDQGSGGHVLALAVHHIASDGQSSVLLGAEIRELCAALAAGREPGLAPLPVQYADYAVWQRDRMTEAFLEPQLAFWREELAGLPRLDLPADHPRPAVRDPRGATLTFEVPRACSDGLSELSRRRGTTPLAAYLTAFCTLLARWSGQWDVPLGVPTAGRTRPELAGVAGPFHNTLVVRCALEPEMSFASAMDAVWERNRRALAHRDVPFERVVEALAPARDLSRTPLYQVMFNFMEEGVTVSGGGDLDPLRDVWGVAKTDLTLFLHTAPDGSVKGIIEYATSLFDEPTIARMAEHYLRVLAAAPGGATLRELGAHADAPRGPIERLLAERCSELLGREVGVMQNFFHLGGTSRLALTLMAHVQEDFDLDLPVRLIFERPSVARLAEAVRALAGAGPDQQPTVVEEQRA